MTNKVRPVDFKRKEKLQIIESYVDKKHALMVVNFKHPEAQYCFTMQDAFDMRDTFDRAARCLKELHETGDITSKEFLGEG